MATSSKKAYAVPRSAAPRAPSPWQSTLPVPPQEMLKHSSVLVSVGVSVFWCTQGLFEPSEHFWQEWGLILNAILPPYHLAGASPLFLDVGHRLTVARALRSHCSCIYHLARASLPWTWGISYVYFTTIKNNFKKQKNGYRGSGSGKKCCYKHSCIGF